MLRKREEEEDRTTNKCISASSSFLLFLFIFSNEESQKACVYKGLGEGREEGFEGSRTGEGRGKKEDPGE